MCIAMFKTKVYLKNSQTLNSHNHLTDFPNKSTAIGLKPKSSYLVSLQILGQGCAKSHYFQ